jgi:hypothetical protein
MENFIKILALRAELLHADGLADGQTHGRADRRTEMTKLIAALRKFSDEPNNPRKPIS